MVRNMILRLSKSPLFMQVSTVFAYLTAITSVAALIGITLSYLGATAGFVVRLGAELNSSRAGDRVFLSVLTLFFGVLSLGVLARDRHVRKPGVDIRNG